ncbi:hypothetical protein ACI2KR_07920 [Pseudomonas luteola]
MGLLYCPDCSAYLMAGDGKCHDCISCGWKQEAELPYDEADNLRDELEQAKNRIRNLESDYDNLASFVRRSLTTIQFVEKHLPITVEGRNVRKKLANILSDGNKLLEG